MTPSALFAERMERVSEDDIISERNACLKAGVSKGFVAAARSRGGRLNYDGVMAIAKVLIGKGYRREWILFGEGDRLAGTSGDMVRLGPGADVAESGPSIVASSALKKGGRQSKGAAPDKRPAAGQNGRRAKRVVSDRNVNHR